MRFCLLESIYGFCHTFRSIGIPCLPYDHIGIFLFPYPDKPQSESFRKIPEQCDDFLDQFPESRIIRKFGIELFRIYEETREKPIGYNDIFGITGTIVYMMIRMHKSSVESIQYFHVPFYKILGYPFPIPDSFVYIRLEIYHIRSEKKKVVFHSPWIFRNISLVRLEEFICERLYFPNDISTDQTSRSYIGIQKELNRPHFGIRRIIRYEILHPKLPGILHFHVHTGKMGMCFLSISQHHSSIEQDLQMVFVVKLPEKKIEYILRFGLP